MARPDRCTHGPHKLPILALAALAGLAPAPTYAQGHPDIGKAHKAPEITAADYSRASQLLSWNTGNLLAGGAVRPNWIAKTDRFWYRNNSGEGFEFILVDPVRNTRGPLFDRHRLASAMSLAADTSFTGVKLPFQTFDFVGDEAHIAFNANKKRFECDIRAYSCTLTDTLPDARAFAVSPDSTKEVFMQGYDLYVRPFRGGDTVRLTNDGEEYFRYGAGSPRPSQVKQNRPSRPQVAWSPDSRRLAVMRPDERGVEMMHFVSYTPQRPKHYAFPYALPGDSIIPQPIFHVLELPEDLAAAAASGDSARAHAVQNHQIVFEPDIWNLSFGGAAADSAWSSDSETLYVHYFTRGAKKLILGAVEAETGEHRVLVGDSSKTNVIGVNWTDPKSFYVTRDRETVIWWSEDDGWAHLYRYDGNDNLVNQITSGPWTVGVLQYVDEARQQLYFTGRGKETDRLLYYAHLYRVNFDGSGLTLLTPEDANHEITFSPSGEYFVDVQSRIESPPVSVLRRARDGSVVRTLEEADVTLLEGVGWRPAEVFRVKGRDGITDVYGVVYFPPDLDPEKKYPVIEHIYPGPFIGSVGSWTFKGGGEQFALASLGFVVVQIDHIGSHYRSKAFHDNYYGNMGDNGIPDHVVGVQQLAVRYPFMDLDRVGIYGHSGGGFASTDAILRFPDFYKVAVSGAGNHDNRTYGVHWGPLYQGLYQKDTVKGGDNYESQANQLIAGNLKGKLLLMHGDMDDNVHPAMTIQVVNQLIRLNKDFDLIIAPDRAHGLNEPYFIRRRWDYFVRHLMGAEPPKEFEIRRPQG
jgi:dipeptidyl aminopeptidase/acylaminoacyl peptidase